MERDDLHREVLRTQGKLTSCFGYDAMGRKAWQFASTLPAEKLSQIHNPGIQPELLVEHAYVSNSTGWIDPYGLSPSQQLASAMARAGNTVPSGYAAHHLIPTNVLNKSNLIQEAIKRGIYNPNGASNGSALPTTSAESLSSGKPLPSGGHLGSYYDAARNRILNG